MKKINTHMTLSDRIVIEQGLRDGKSFKDIAAIIQKDTTTVSKEIRRAVNSDDWKTDPVDCFSVAISLSSFLAFFIIINLRKSDVCFM